MKMKDIREGKQGDEEKENITSVITLLGVSTDQWAELPPLSYKLSNLH